MAKKAKRQLRGKAAAAIKDKEGDIWDKEALDALFNKTI